MLKLIDCYNGTLGDQLQQQAGQRTTNASPDQPSFVPWLIFNNVSIKSQAYRWDEILPVAICQWFVADQVPDVCKNY
uniref:Uncharacterized protein n=1 Tax=Ditylenchus dipsaci TaxID=166011 RepID=A0A915E4V9_9BILA